MKRICCQWRLMPALCQGYQRPRQGWQGKKAASSTSSTRAIFTQSGACIGVTPSRGACGACRVICHVTFLTRGCRTCLTCGTRGACGCGGCGLHPKICDEVHLVIP